LAWFDGTRCKAGGLEFISWLSAVLSKRHNARMTPQNLLSHYDSAQLWPSATGLDVGAAYQAALAVRALRIARGEQPRGYKIGFTNRNIWPRYNATAPIWGAVYSSTLVHCEGQTTLSLQGTSQPRIEPEAVLSLRSTPPANCSLEQLFGCVDWVAPGFEIVQSHLQNWKFALPDAVADGSLHARLIVGKQVPVRSLAGNAQDFCQLLAKAAVKLSCNGQQTDSGQGANVLGDPLSAMLHFVHEVQACPGAPTLQAGDVITTGTWTDAWPIAAGQTWVAQFDAPLSALSLRFEP
jgi:2-keto-4-pentenoate hydratase